MKKVYAIAALLAAGIAGMFVAGVPVQAGNSTYPIVTVGNVPLPVAGTVNIASSATLPVTGTVNIGNMPTVNAQQSGPWSVSITGTPSVSIADGTVSATPPSIKKFRYISEPGLGGSGTYDFQDDINVTTILVCSHDDITVRLIVHIDGSQESMFIGNFGDTGGKCQPIVLGASVVGAGFSVTNRNTLTSATFELEVLGY